MRQTKTFLLSAALFALAWCSTTPMWAGDVLHIVVDAPIHKGSAEFIIDAIDEADAAGASAFVMELSTPGGMLDQTRRISSAMLEAETPIVVFVSPAGAQAASAGFFILMSADIAAMAPGTNTGAAHPVGGSGEDIEGTMGEKVEQDALAQIRSLAERHNRDLDLAEAAVLDSRSYTADEALESGLIDFLAEDLRDLVSQLEGRSVTRGEETLTLAVADSDLREIEMTQFQRFLSVFAHPNIAAILMTLGMLGLYTELTNPGMIFPGVVGAICLVMAFVAFSVLPVNYAGIALVLLAVTLFIAEVKFVSYGMLSVAGTVALGLGYMLLFRSTDPALRMSWSVILMLVGVSAVSCVALLTLAIRSQRRAVTTGREGLLLEHGEARTAVDGSGKVFVHGELWNATSTVPIQPGTRIKVVSVEGMVLAVEPAGD